MCAYMLRTCVYVCIYDTEARKAVQPREECSAAAIECMCAYMLGGRVYVCIHATDMCVCVHT